MSDNSGQIKIDETAVIDYDRRDPRFGFTIEDSDEYTRNIYPLHFKKKCHNSQEFDDLMKYDWPVISRCWGERYENCAVMKRYSVPFVEADHCACSECAMTLYGAIEDTLGYARVDLGDSADDDDKTLVRSEFKPQNESTIYDRTRVMTNDNLVIDKRPDTKECGVIRSRPENVAGLTDLANDVEPFDIINNTGGGKRDPFIDSCFGSYQACLDFWGLPREAVLIFVILCVLLCCVSCSGSIALKMRR